MGHLFVKFIKNSNCNQYDFIKSWILWAYQISKSSIKLYILALNSTLLMNIWRHKACNLTCQAFMYWFNMCILPHREHVKACIFVTLIQSKLILSVPIPIEAQLSSLYDSMFIGANFECNIDKITINWCGSTCCLH